MAIDLTNQYSLVANIKRTDEKGNTVPVAEVLGERNEMLVNAPAKRANQIWSHQSNKRTKLPTPGLRAINEGGTLGKSDVESVRESIMNLDLQIEIDEDLIDPYPNGKELRVLETRAHLEGASQEVARLFVYGNQGDDAREMNGLATRYNDLALDNVRSVGGSGSDLTSLWLVEWDDMTAHVIYAEGGDTGINGINVRDKGKVRVTDDSGNPFYAYAQQIKIQVGLSIIDDRAVQRLANIESSGATNNFVDSTNMRELVYARNSLPNMGMDGRTFIYVNRDVKSQLDIYALEKSNGFYMMEDITGRPLPTFQGIPIRMVEKLLSTESAVA